MKDIDDWTQLTLDDAMALTAEEVHRVRDDAIGQADANALPDWRAAAVAAVRWCARNHRTFTTDEVLARLSAVNAPKTHNLSALGPVMLELARHGVIVKTGDMRPSRLARRHRDLTVWRAR